MPLSIGCDVDRKSHVVVWASYDIFFQTLCTACNARAFHVEDGFKNAAGLIQLPSAGARDFGRNTSINKPFTIKVVKLPLIQ